MSLETPVGDGDSLYSDLIEDEYTQQPEARRPSGCSRSSSGEALDRLEPRLRDVLERRFGLAAARARRRSSTSAQELGITRERVRQLETRALKELRTTAPELCAST